MKQSSLVNNSDFVSNSSLYIHVYNSVVYCDLSTLKIFASKMFSEKFLYLTLYVKICNAYSNMYDKAGV